jgi:hypothetical protein
MAGSFSCRHVVCAPVWILRQQHPVGRLLACLLLCLQVGLCHLGDYLLSQLDCCAPQLTKLVMPDVDVNGTGDCYTSTTSHTREDVFNV